LGKVKAIAHEPLVHGHLRVCWANSSNELNCGVCEKCVRTQAQFAVAGTLDKLKTFPGGSLVQRVEALARVETSLRNQWAEISQELGSGELKTAIDKLIDRSAPEKDKLFHIRTAGVSIFRQIRAKLSL
jgi:hypothetical protein